MQEYIAGPSTMVNKREIKAVFAGLAIMSFNDNSHAIEFLKQGSHIEHWSNFSNSQKNENDIYVSPFALTRYSMLSLGSSGATDTRSYLNDLAKNYSRQNTKSADVLARDCFASIATSIAVEMFSTPLSFELRSYTPEQALNVYMHPEFPESQRFSWCRYFAGSNAINIISEMNDKIMRCKLGVKDVGFFIRALGYTGSNIAGNKLILLLHQDNGCLENSDILKAIVTMYESLAIIVYSQNKFYRRDVKTLDEFREISKIRASGHLRQIAQRSAIEISDDAMANFAEQVYSAIAFAGNQEIIGILDEARIRNQYDAEALKISAAIKKRKIYRNAD
ncbi:MAG: hypothetical protein M5R36_02655 [Deltaproteobacteria bacterium]|nr:hypothetical protein [Deltaproteobacteria bacterium]